MEPFVTLVSRAVPLPLDHVDTDVITPMKRVMEGPEAMVRHAFEPLRFDETGAPRPGFPLDDPAFEGARILVVGANFGCGSSRETAVWALSGLGLRCVVGASFADIFASNCFKNGLLPVTLPPAALAEVMDAARRREEVTVSLEEQVVVLADGTRHAFHVPAVRKEALRAGLDELGLVLRRLDRIEAFEARDRRARPWVYDLPTGSD